MAKLNENEQYLLTHGVCPDCQAMFLIGGPRGGLATNTLCGYCRSEFNMSAVCSERLTTHCDPARQKELYGIDEAEYPPHTYPRAPRPAYAEKFEADLLKGCPDPNCDHSHGPLHSLVVAASCHPEEPGVTVAYRKGTGQLFLSCQVCAKPILVVEVASRDQKIQALRVAAGTMEKVVGMSAEEIVKAAGDLRTLADEMEKAYAETKK